MTRPLHFLALIALVLSAAWAGSAAIAARTPYDGNWSVSIWTEEGGCDRGYRYELAVVDGRVTYRGQGSFRVTGRVDARGRVNVTVSRGSSQASGTGRLTRDSGRGRWKGRSAHSVCSGTWEAERR